MTWSQRSLVFLVATQFYSLSWAVTKNKPFQQYNYSKGLDTYHNPQSLPEGFVQDANNVLFNDKTPVDKRAGYTVAWSTKSYSFSGLWTYTDATNTTWQLARSSDQITANNLAGTTVLVATISANNLAGEANAFGNAYFVDQTQGVYYWNGTSTTYVNPSPKGSIIDQFHGRLWVAGAAVPSGNQLYGSGYFAGNTWTTGLNPTDPVQYSIGLQDNFDNITAEYVYLDTQYIFKHYSIFALYGFDQTSFQISQLTQECGCIDGGTIQTYNSGLKFMSLRGVENFNGYTCTRISDPVKNKVDPAIQVAGFSQQSWTQSQQADWNAGTLNQLSAAISPPTLVLSTQVAFVGTDSTTANFASGSTYVNVDTTSVSNSVILSTYLTTPQSPIQQLTNNGSPDGTFNITQINWMSQSFTTSNSSQQVTTAKLYLGSRGGGCNTTLRIKNDNSGAPGSDIVTTSILASGITASGSLLTFSFTPTILNPNTLYWLYIDGCGNGSTNDLWYFATGNPYSGGMAVHQSDTGTFIFNGTQDFEFEVDFQGIQLYNTSGSFISRVFDVGFDTNTFLWNWTNINSNYTVSSGQTVTFQTQVSTSVTGIYDALVSASTGTTIPSATKRIIQYKATLTTPDGTKTPTLTEIDLNTSSMEKSTGTIKSQIHNIGTLGSFGIFPVSDSLNGGTIAFSICQSTHSDMSSQQSCLNQTPNSQILVSTGVSGANNYVQWYATFTVTNATQTPTLNAVTVQWYNGNPSIPMASTIWDNRYWLSLTSNTFDTGNDDVLVLDKDNTWTSFDIHAGAFTQTKGNLYHADSTTTGNIYLDNQGFSDNGKAINAYIKTRTFGLGDFASDDYLYVVYPSALNTGNCAMNISYRMDGGGTSYSLGSPLLSEYASMSSVRLPFPVDSSHQDFGQSIDFTFGTNDGICDFQFYGFEGLFKERPIQ